MVRTRDPSGRHRRLSFCGRPWWPARRGALSGAIIIAAATIVPANSNAQETVVVGSGLPEIEVNLEALEDIGRGRRPSRTLLMPGGPKADTTVALAPPSEVARRAPRPKRVEERPVASTAPTLELEPPPKPAPRETARIEEPTPVEEPLPPDELSPPPVEAPEPPRVEEAPPLVEEVPPAAETPPEPAPPPLEPAIAEPEATETASLPPAIRLPPGGGQVLRIEFREASTRIQPAAQESLRAVAVAAKESDGRLQLKAFAGGSADTASGARRTSLSRALAVRSFLIEQGVRSTRIDVRALGGANDDGPAERVDVLYIDK